MKLENLKHWPPRPTTQRSTPDPDSALVIQVLPPEGDTVKFIAVSKGCKYEYSLKMANNKLAQIISRFLDEYAIALNINELGSLSHQAATSV